MKLVFVKVAHFALYLFVIINILSYSNSSLGNDMENPLYVLPKECNFNSVANNSGLKSDCSPQLIKQFPNNDFQGILINGAHEVIWPKNVSLTDMVVKPSGDAVGPLKCMIAGLINIPYGTLNLQGRFATKVMVVAVDQRTAKTYSGKMAQLGFPAHRAIEFELGDEQNKIDALAYFSIDLVQNLKIPIANATYVVYATLGDYKSNVLMVKTTIK